MKRSISFDECSRLDLSLTREWLETNGLGGFASSTVVGLNTRRYHGLLTAATTPPTGRMLLLSKLEEIVIIGGQKYELSANEYPGAIHPKGHVFQREFRLDPFPTFVYRVEDYEITKRVFMVHGENTTVVEYELRSLSDTPNEGCELEIKPLVAFRDYHSTAHHNTALNPQLKSDTGVVSLRAYEGLPDLYFANNAHSFEAGGDWYHDFEYRMERERGLDYREDLYQPFTLRFNLSHRHSAIIIASTERHDAKRAPVLRSREQRRRETVSNAAPIDDSFIRSLTNAADQFIVQRGALKTIIAGYHWFTDWGRDTMIALPGLTLCTGRFGVAKDILRAFANSADQGMLPNRFPDSGETPEFNTVDATLWFFEAARAYLEYTADETFIREEIYPVLKDVVEWHLRGTRYGIHVDTDGLLSCGEPGVQLTWMDAKVGDWVVTPRAGKPVEIQALWYNALQIMHDLSVQFNDHGPATLFEALAAEARQSFEGKFWNAEANCLYDVADPHDGSIRPNQIFAVSLRHSVLSEKHSRAVVETVERELLTPLGLRTLARHDPRYRRTYEGGVAERDTAYHLGTVWPWLMGPFITAYLRVHGRTEEAVERARGWLSHFEEHLNAAGMGSVSEIADAEYPHTSRGCISQAWSVAELLRSAVEDVHAVRRYPVRARAEKAHSPSALGQAQRTALAV